MVMSIYMVGIIRSAGGGIPNGPPTAREYTKLGKWVYIFKSKANRILHRLILIFIPKLANDKFLQVFAERINRHFSKDWGYPNGFIEAKYCEPWERNMHGSLILRIGARDIQVSSQGKFLGAGTAMDLDHEFRKRKIDGKTIR